jgi:hypothetical protein
MPGKWRARRAAIADPPTHGWLPWHCRACPRELGRIDPDGYLHLTLSAVKRAVSDRGGHLAVQCGAPACQTVTFWRPEEADVVR